MNLFHHHSPNTALQYLFLILLPSSLDCQVLEDKNQPLGPVWPQVSRNKRKTCREGVVVGLMERRRDEPSKVRLFPHWCKQRRDSASCQMGASKSNRYQLYPFHRVASQAHRSWDLPLHSPVCSL